MGMTIAYSTRRDAQDALRDLRQQTTAAAPAMVVYFAAAAFEPNEISRRMQQLFPGVPMFGCSSAGEIVSGKMLKNSIVMMLFDDDVIDDVCVEVIEQISTAPRVADALKRFEAYYQTPIAEMSYQEYVGIILIDGLSLAEETVMEKLGDATNITFIGGAAADNMQFQATYVYANGRAYADAALLALIKPLVRFDVIKTQSFCPRANTLMATKVNEATREVVEFNQKPAVQAYAEALNIAPEQAAAAFFESPLGLMIGNEPYVRSPQKIVGDRIRFFCRIKEGMELRPLESMDIIEDTRRAVASKQAEMGGISGLIDFHCVQRMLELEQKGLTEAYGKLFADIPTIGFCTYGEEYIGHINQTSTMLVFR